MLWTLATRWNPRMISEIRLYAASQQVFTNVGVGKQNAMSFVATCKNY